MSPSPDDVATPSARQLLFNLLLVSDGGVLDAASAVRACALFGISANNARVTLNRLLSSGLVDAVGRGAYRLGKEGQALGEDVGSWRTAEAAVRPWGGNWVLALTGNLGRVDRGALRTRERALAMVGMKELEDGVYIRPDNLAGGVSLVRARLLALGVAQPVAVLGATELDAQRDAHARQLWDVKALVKGYRAGCQTLAKSLVKLEALSDEAAARHAYLLGDKAIRQLVFDPMLPEPLIDVSERRAFREKVLHYENAGRAIWRRFYAAG